MPAESPNPPPLRNIVAMLAVSSVTRSAAFYARLGLEVAHSHCDPGCPDEPVWAWLQSGHGASLMLSLRDSPMEAGPSAVMFYLYCDDVDRMHDALQAAGVLVGDVTYPFYCPKGEFRLVDPDGHVCMVTHT